MDFKRSKLNALLELDAFALASYKEAINHKVHGTSFWRPAADSIVKSAEAYEKLKMKLVAACIYVEAAETFIKIDKSDAMKAYKKASTLFCDLSRFDLAGKIERKIAEICFDICYWEEAAHHFKRAANFLTGEMMHDQCDLCFEKAAECFVRLSDYEEARFLFEKLAASAVKTNLRRFNARDYLFKAFICAISEMIEISVDEYKAINEAKKKYFAAKQRTPKNDQEIEEEEDEEEPDFRTNSQKKYDFLYDLCDSDYYQIDFMWKNSVQRKFCRNLLAARLKCDRHDFIDHVYHYHNIRPIEQIFLILLKIPMEEIPHELEVKKHIEEEQRKEAERQKLLDLLASSGSLAKMEEKEKRESVGEGSEGRTSANSSIQQEAGRTSLQEGRTSMEGGRSSIDEGRPSIGSDPGRRSIG